MRDTTVHVIGKCVIKGCKQRKRHTFAGRIITNRYGTRTEWSIPTEVGAMSAHSMWHGKTPTVAQLGLYANDRNVQPWINAMRAHGWICADHERVMRVVAVAGVVNVDKSCDGRCMNATSGACDCSCGGANHGATWG